MSASGEPMFLLWIRIQLVPARDNSRQQAIRDIFNSLPGSDLSGYRI